MTDPVVTTTTGSITIPASNGYSQEAMRAENEALKAKIAALEGKKPEVKPEPIEEDLNDKARKNRQTEDEKASEMKGIEAALKFNMTVKHFVEENKALLPNEITDLLRESEKEKYDDATQRASVVKAAIMKAYFAVEDNRSVLTSNQKLQLDDYLKLTKTGREEKANSAYENIFEPAIETMRRIKKAEELALARNPSYSSNIGDPYLQKMQDRAKKRFIGDKHVT